MSLASRPTARAISSTASRRQGSQRARRTAALRGFVFMGSFVPRKSTARKFRKFPLPSRSVVLQSSTMNHDERRDQRTQVLRARCEPRLKARVSELAARRGHDEADVVRQAVIELLERVEKPAEVTP